jgi:hypothetical protein
MGGAVGSRVGMLAGVEGAVDVAMGGIVGMGALVGSFVGVPFAGDGELSFPQAVKPRVSKSTRVHKV